ncbi:hypothetical protein ILYODFUR_028663 [Ilyodon furcidens]|uniref:Uncharacterized protein n=1 Tax=Ilyodon furcidens TaxID=33524 RepID=A0ABV0TFS4_9TELE
MSANRKEVEKKSKSIAKKEACQHVGVDVNETKDGMGMVLAEVKQLRKEHTAASNTKAMLSRVKTTLNDVLELGLSKTSLFIVFTGSDVRNPNTADLGQL